jgi:protein TonB
MPATLEARPRERLIALAAVALIQLGLGLALLIGLRVDVVRHAQMAEQLIAIVLAKPPPPPPPPPPIVHHPDPARPQPSAPPQAAPTPLSIPNPAPPPTPRVALRPTPAPPAGGSGAGQGIGAGVGSGNAGFGGSGDGAGGTDMIQIAGSIEDSDMPRHLREAGFRGRVSFIFTVEPTGRVDRCLITRSSGVPELDQLTCRLIVQRFRYRPSTDRNGRPIAEEVDGDEDWGTR